MSSIQPNIEIDSYPSGISPELLGDFKEFGILQDSTEHINSRTFLDSILERRQPIRSMDSNVSSTARYFEEIRTYPLLKHTEEISLSQLVEKGRVAADELEKMHHLAVYSYDREQMLLQTHELGAEAKSIFIKSNLRLVVSIAKRYPISQGLDLLDHIQEGNLGLEHAVDMFDWRQGFKFSTYASYWIRQSISRSISGKASTIRLPLNESDKLRAATRLADLENIPMSSEMEHLKLITRTSSLDVQIGDDADIGIIDMLANDGPSPEEEALESYDRESATRLLETLSPAERELVKERFGFYNGKKRTYSEIAKNKEINSEAVRRRLEKILGRLRLNSDSLKYHD